ncbi:hypothetical protein GCM10010988_28450 [Cnuibacter physcomitrellae]|uniref:class I SAM-dependent methyltransferase n=1 Tax=Cnuibacter physcomitrellae TaxID=1619308 RepID=UPI00157D4CF6|nr:class I SAM-dependent methyltransferase [Cnuibacter physcomitrellae]GGI40312.1 hypothetical protein GCM10010988_28450 [Cnuibacter physcomitrellae]
MTDTTLDPSTLARELSKRWDAQQTGYIRHRAERFATIARVVEAVTEDVERPRVLDLAGGTGSLGHAVLAAVPRASLVVADKDPALLAIASDIATADPRIDVADVDLGRPGWDEHPLLAGERFDAIVSSTALHWLQPAQLVDVYWRTADLLAPGGILLNGDHLSYDEHLEPTLRRVAAADDERMQTETFSGSADTWDEWWAAVAAEPRYSRQVARREEVWGDDIRIAPPKVSLEFHLSTLRSAGFTETGTVWRYLDDHVLYGIR